MTDGQKLDLILSKMTDMQNDIGVLKADATIHLNNREGF